MCMAVLSMADITLGLCMHVCVQPQGCLFGRISLCVYVCQEVYLGKEFNSFNSLTNLLAFRTILLMVQEKVLDNCIRYRFLVAKFYLVTVYINCT